MRAAVVLLLPLANLVSGFNVNIEGRVPGPSASTKHGAVASEVKECSDAGVGILKDGGTAADAIIATGLCVGTISAYHSGIGGGGFMLIRSQNKHGKQASYEMIDFRERAPGLSNETMYSNNTDHTASTIGGLAVGVPGELRGWEALHKKHGKLPWQKLFQPAIHLARNGFKINPELLIAINPASYPYVSTDPLFAEVYAPNGTVLGINETAYRKRYADTLETISKKGADAFYSGPIANRTAVAAQQAGGILTVEDLKNYTVVHRTPASISYRGKYKIFSTIAPSSGSIVLSTLKAFEGYDGSAGPGDADYNLTTHRLIQANRFGYSVRTNFGDPAYTANVSTIEASALTDEYGAYVRSEITNTTHDATYYNLTSFTSVYEGGTSHMAAVDQWGNAISLTTTVNLYWGSRVMTEDGIILNNEMDDFSSPGSTNSFGFPASPINFIRPGKRPQSSISSSIAEDLHTGEFIMATGAAGGSRIITTTLQHLHNHLDRNMTAKESEFTPRWHDQLTNVTYFELPDPVHGITGFDNTTVDYLKGLGYNATFAAAGSAGHVIIKKDGVFDAASEARQSASGASTY
ncbi:gamma-glutamyltranspeptidase [Flagelloscypha sp. PMI_526]|nr:gamma-glutamyltranspeptidase [Flagelloscypha sp. PMI_526]